jgi:hypothetical protein
LTIDAGEDVKCQLLWSLNDDVLACWVPANHVVVFGALEETLERGGSELSANPGWAKMTKGYSRIQFREEGGLGLGVRFGHVVLLLLLLLLALLLLAVMLLLELWRVSSGICFWWRIVIRGIIRGRV